MAYDGNGNYIRPHNWSQDAANGVNINAAEMDQEDNGLAAALSIAVTRDGQGKMAQDFLPAVDNTLNLGTNARRWASVNGVPIASIVSGIFYAQTAAEAAASVNPTLFTFPPANPWRYGADGTGGAADIAALATASTIAAATGVSGFKNIVQIASYLRTAAEIAAVVLPINYSYPTQPYDIRRYGAKLDNATDDTAAITTGLLVGNQTVNGAQGSAIAVSAGNSLLSTMVPLPNRVRVLGVNKRGSYFKATAGWAIGNGVAAYNAGTTYGVTTGTALVLVTSGGILYASRQPSNVGNTPASSPTFWTPISNAMFYAQNGYTNSPVPGTGISMFDSTLENLSVDANNLAGLGCVLSSAWQEDCGLRGALLLNFDTYGIKFQDAFGGASLGKVVDCEIFRGTLPTGGTGIDLSAPMGGVGAFMLHVADTSITGGTNNLTNGIWCNGNSLRCDIVHFENCTNGILVDGTGWITLVDVDGAGGSALVTNLVTIASTFTGALRMINCRRNGSTNFLNDLRAGGLGVIAGYDPPDLEIGPIPNIQPGANWSGGSFTVSGGVISMGGSFNCSVVRNSAGNFTVTEAKARSSTQSSAPWAVGGQNTTGFYCSAALAGGGSYTIITSINGTPTDPTGPVNFGNVRTQ